MIDAMEVSLKKVQNKSSPGWDDRRVQRVIGHYEGQTDEEAATEDEMVLSCGDHLLAEGSADLARATRDFQENEETMKTKKHDVPAGWDHEQLHEIADYYDNQSDEEAIAEAEAALEAEGPRGGLHRNQAGKS
jgi:hypothetical protein